MLYTKDEVSRFRKMFSEARELSTGTVDAMYWVPLRNVLVKKQALYYNPHYSEFLFQAIQLNELGESESDWNDTASYIAKLQVGERVKLTNRMYSSWAMILQNNLWRSMGKA